MCSMYGDPAGVFNAALIFAILHILSLDLVGIPNPLILLSTAVAGAEESYNL